MGKFDKNVFSSEKQDYETPDPLFKLLDSEFHFTLDVCADSENHKTDKYFTVDDDGLSKDWDGVCWMNPPYNAKRQWIQKAYTETIRNPNCIVVCLIPARTNTNWWHNFCQKGEIRFIKGRPIFRGMSHGLPQPLAIVIFGSGYVGNYKSVEY